MSTIARGVIAREIGALTQVEEFTIDDSGPQEVLVRILACGVCHSDLSLRNGLMGAANFPWLLGHEGAGVIEQVGPGVSSERIGEHVILAWRAPCGSCRFCLAGQPHLCAASRTAAKRMRTNDGEVLTQMLGIGAFCTYTLVHAAQAIPVSSDLPAASLSLIGCGVMTGVGAALHTAQMRPGTSAAIFGCGGVGDSVIQGARLAGAAKIIAVDIDPQKLAWARQFGATHTVNARDGDPVAQIKALTGGNGVNYAFEAVGRPETLAQALACRDRGGVCVLIGVPSTDATLTLPLQQFLLMRGSLHGSAYGDCLPTRDFPMLVEWYRQGRLQLDELVTCTIALDEVEEAFRAMERGETLRSVVVLEG